MVKRSAAYRRWLRRDEHKRWRRAAKIALRSGGSPAFDAPLNHYRVC